MEGTHAIARSADVTGQRAPGRSSMRSTASTSNSRSLLLKTNMVLSGYDCPTRPPPTRSPTGRSAAWAHVPVAVPGVVFLSGGQSDETATVNLDAMNRCGQQPWELSFSFGRALQASALRAWANDPTDLATAQGELQRRAAETAAARTGTYARNEPSPAVAAHA